MRAAPASVELQRAGPHPARKTTTRTHHRPAHPAAGRAGRAGTAGRSARSGHRAIRLTASARARERAAERERALVSAYAWCAVRCVGAWPARVLGRAHRRLPPSRDVPHIGPRSTLARARPLRCGTHARARAGQSRASPPRPPRTSPPRPRPLPPRRAPRERPCAACAARAPQRRHRARATPQGEKGVMPRRCAPHTNSGIVAN